MMSRRIFSFLALALAVVPVILVSGDEHELDSLYNCVDWECGEGDGEWISKGKTLLTYFGKTDKHLSFKKNEDIYIVGKPRDKDLPDWVGKIGDKVGLVPKGMVREDKMNSKRSTEADPDEEDVREAPTPSESSPPFESVVEDIDEVVDREADVSPESESEKEVQNASEAETLSSSTTELPMVGLGSDKSFIFNPYDTLGQSSEQKLASVETMEHREQEIVPQIVSSQAKEEASTDQQDISSSTDTDELSSTSLETGHLEEEPTIEEVPSTTETPEMSVDTTEIPIVDSFVDEAVLSEAPSTTEMPPEEGPTESNVFFPPDFLNQQPAETKPIDAVEEEEREQEIVQQIISGEESTELPPQEQHADETTDHPDHDHTHHHHHHHHHGHHSHDFFKTTNETSSIIIVIKHLSSTLLSFLPEPLQDTILDVDDALVFTGIIALTLVSICVPYFFIEGYMSVRPLKKKVVELNKSLWKVSAAYETQQEEFEIFKQKAIAHDEFKKRAEQSENDVIILKKLETKQREQITSLKSQLKSQTKEAIEFKTLIEKTLDDKKTVFEECRQYKTAYETTKESLVKAREDLNNIQAQAKSSSVQLGLSTKNAEMLASKLGVIEQEMEEVKSQLAAECEKRKDVQKENRQVEESKMAVEKELAEIRNICHQYETTVSDLNDEISKLESDLATIKESLGEDSPFLEVAEIQAKAAYSEKEAESLRARLDGLTADNDNLSGKLKETAAALEETRAENEHTSNRLQVLETYFKEREEEYIKTIEQLQLKESVRDKGKEELIRIIEEKENVCKDLNERLETLKEEFEETKQQHRNEIRSLEAKGHENWLSLCQAERKAQDARKEAELLRQRLTVMSKEKDDEDGDGLNGEVPLFPVIPHELVPPPIFDEPPSYFGLGDFVPPPPLPEGEEREPHRPPPLGGRLSPSFSDLDDNILSPIGVGRREDDCTDGSSGSDSPRRSPQLRGGWVNVQHDRGGQGMESMRRLSRATSSPIQPGANL